MTPRLLLGCLIVTLVLAISGPLPAHGTSLAETVATIEKKHQTQMEVARPEQSVAVSFCSAAETWAAVAGDVARQLKAEDAQAFLDKAQRIYQLNSGRMDAPSLTQLAGLNFLYQSLDILATLLARQNQDANAQELIVETEQKLRSLVGQPGGSQPGPASAALSGGVMTMLAVICGQVDHQGAMKDLLAKETQRRRQIDSNIYTLKETSPEAQMTMLTNNHLFGALSVLQIIGLARAPDLKPRLRQIEEKLVSQAGDNPDQQMQAGSLAVVEAGFLVAPTFGDR